MIEETGDNESWPGHGTENTLIFELLRRLALADRLVWYCNNLSQEVLNPPL